VLASGEKRVTTVLGLNGLGFVISRHDRRQENRATTKF
jgi:hypothetical protein